MGHFQLGYLISYCAKQVGTSILQLRKCRPIWIKCPPLNPLMENKGILSSNLLLFPRGHFSSVQSCPTLCNTKNWSTPGFPVHHRYLELAQTQVHRVGDSIKPSHPLSSPSSPAFNLSQHHGLFQWVSSSHQVGKVLEFQLQHQPFWWIFRTDFL